MIQSMTGYGKAEAHYNGKKIHAEIKSLNSKSLDLSARIAPIYREKEMDIRQLISSALERGKIDFNLWVEKDTASQALPLNPDSVANYLNQIREISAANDIPFPGQNIWEVLVKLPDTTQTPVIEELSDEEWEVALGAVEAAIAALVDFRKQEGEALYAKFTEKVNNIEEFLGAIEPFEKSRVEKIRQRLFDRLAELKGVDYDKNRLEQELIYYIEKLDISEEKQRLTNHLKYFRETLDGGHGQGKKLGFIAQEMGREINTTGSKSNQAEMQNIVVKMKDELEQIKEQVMNVL
ncbi:MAG: YicC/YloC family endoribonuclease [Bacteroidales bacterium]|nr:YicC/YloC family endoribonuclease [Bacteroidales bacterium]